MAIGTVCADDESEVRAALAAGDLVDVDVSVTGNLTIAAAAAGKRGAIGSALLKSTGDGNIVQLVYGSSPTDVSGPITLNDGDELDIDAVKEGFRFIGPVNEDLKLKFTISAGKISGALTPAYVKPRGVIS